jgi:hypothetical protein
MTATPEPRSVSSRDTAPPSPGQQPGGLIDASSGPRESADSRLSAALYAVLPGLGWFRRFVLERVEDPTGLSGVGIVALGVALPSGRCIMQWRTTDAVGPGSTSIYDSLGQLVAIHGHGGATVVRWIDRVEPLFLVSSLDHFTPAAAPDVLAVEGTPGAAA